MNPSRRWAGGGLALYTDARCAVPLAGWGHLAALPLIDLPLTDLPPLPAPQLQRQAPPLAPHQAGHLSSQPMAMAAPCAATLRCC